MTNVALQSVDLLRSDGTPIAGLVPIRGRHTRQSSLSVDEQAAIKDAESFERIDFVFFRRFSDGRSSQVAAYVVDNSNERLDENSLARLHLQLWLHGATPLLYVAWPTRIDVLTCARGPDFWRNEQCQYKPAKKIKMGLRTAAAITNQLRQFSAFRLADGTFWEDRDNRDLANYAKAAHQSLIQALVDADRELKGAENPVLRRLLLLMVLIKYLEDRGVFPDRGWFGKWHKGARSFFEVLQRGTPDRVYKLLDSLERRFNGDVFSLPREPGRQLTKRDLRTFATLVEARTLKSQRYLWEQYSFEHLAVEIITHLYQRFVRSGHGTVYTPPFLASLLLDHAMPYAELSGKERVLDPACGSGVFLVGAFRRLVNIWLSKNNWRTPNVRTLKRILARCIYGVELDPFAIDLTAFSLSLAICDALQPDVIWNELTFDPLRARNLIEADFFGEVLESRQGTALILNRGFDVIIGNPPFASTLTSAGVEVDRIACETDSSRRKVPDRQMAYLFLEQSLNFLQPGGRVCLIQPAGFLYNRKSDGFRRGVFRKCRVETILDFTSIRNLYEADPKTIAVLAQPEEPTPDWVITHSTFRRTASVKERICFELDHYDRHRVPQKLAESDPYIWRLDLLGGGRLLDLSQRLRSMRTLAGYVKEKGWDYGEGFIAAEMGRRVPAPFLTGKPLLPTRAFTEVGIDEAEIGKVTETLFRSAYTEERYSAPLLLIKEVETLPIAYWDKGPLAYRDKIVGVSAPRPQDAELRQLYEFLRSSHSFYRFCCTLNGTQSLVGKATAILKQDIDQLPCPEDREDFSLSFWEEALRNDVIDYMSEYVRLGQNSRLLTRAANARHLQQYSDLFVRLLGTVYQNLQASEPIFLNGLACQAFHFGTRPNLSWLSSQTHDDLRRLIYDDKYYPHLRTIRVLRFYSENVLLLVKPDRLRYWIRSTAIRDADETLVDLRCQGY